MWSNRSECDETSDKNNWTPFQINPRSWCEIVIDYRYIFHGFGPHYSQTNGNNIFFEDRTISLVSAMRFRENVKNVTPRVFIVTLGIFIASSFFLILMTEWENLVKIENRLLAGYKAKLGLGGDDFIILAQRAHHAIFRHSRFFLLTKCQREL